MAYFLVKTDPDTYSITNLEEDKVTVWDGVRNPQAIRVIKDMHPGDDVLIYHSQGEAAIVGLARVVSEPVTLKEIKESHRFDDWSLVRQGRLSTMSVPHDFVAWMEDRKVL